MPEGFEDVDADKAIADFLKEQKEDAKKRDAEAEKFREKLAADQEEADEKARRFEEEIKPKQLDEARKVREHETFLKENGLEHIRQDNDGDEDYSDLPKSVHMETPDTDDPTSAPGAQQIEPMGYEPVTPEPAPLYNVSFPDQ